eukprot:TRINITY_DN2091_c0_g2_i1.p1 TRINITY_DN2091_c0_g2~~TRINITY_DN2091_c0_g2_i1.p1  ORF type:complete len:549 (-),score=307.80 TRINITY_DN2091_c0_g2_i1:226-1872(-)
MSAPVLVLNSNTTRETGRKAQLGNISASKAVADIIRTCLGPRSMLKMMLDPMGGITITNDGNAILREIDVSHPAAKSMIELSRVQDEEVGDGTTSVIILAGEMLTIAEPWLEKNLHPTIIINAFRKALEDGLVHLEKIAIKIDINNRQEMLKIIKSCIGTKFISRWSSLMCNLALDAVLIVSSDNDRKNIDIKRFVRVEKIPGGEIEESSIIPGVILNKDVTHASMRRRIENPRIILLDCPLEYKKGESQTNVEIKNENDWNVLLRLEEDAIKKMCDDIIKFKPDLVITEKGLSDLAQHFFVKNNITALRRMRKTDSNRIARATGAKIVNRTDEIQESDVGTGCGLYEVRKIGDDYFSFITNCKNPKACTILLRGASKDVLNEIDRNLNDAMSVARNVVIEPKLVPGGGASEMSVSNHLVEKSKAIEGIMQWPYRAAALGLEVIPRTIAQNCGAKTVRTLTELRAKHAAAPIENSSWGIDGLKGNLCDMKELNIWEPFSVKSQTIKTSIEAACLLLRVDDILSGMKKNENVSGAGNEAANEGGEDFEP